MDGLFVNLCSHFSMEIKSFKLFEPLYVIAGVFILTFLLCFRVGTVHAANDAGVSISPAIIEETIQPGTTKEYSVAIQNQNNYEQIFYVSTKNIVDVEDGGVPVFSSNQLEKTGMELTDWIKLSIDKITLPPGATQQLNFSVEVPTDAPPGSHFGSIFISVDPPDIKESGAAVAYQVANIISLRVAGEANEVANIRQFSTNSFFYGTKNVDFSVRIENEGNVLVRPSGPLEIKNMLGQKVDTIVFNESQGAIFPGKVREYKINWKGQGTGFGRYEAIVSPIYGDSGAKKTISSTVSFWILPINIIGPALGILAVILLITFVFVRVYIKRTLAHLSYGQTRIVRKRKSKGMSATLLLVIVMLTVTGLFMTALLVLFA